MARVKPLTNTEVKQAKPLDKPYKLSDGDGLQLRIRPNGSKSWILDYYKPFTRKRTSMSLGMYPDVSLAQARDKRKHARELLAEDIDPKEHREEVVNLNCDDLNTTFKKISIEWFKIHKTKIAEKTGRDLWNSLENHVLPSIGNTPISKIKAVDAIKALRPLAAKGSLEAVRKLCQNLNKIMIFAANTGVIDTNPLTGISQAFETPTVSNRPAIKPEELPELMRALSIANIKLVTRCLIEWQLHTMVRPSEAAGAKWSEIDFDNQLWNIPPERMKKARGHIVPLTNQALALLEIMKPISSHLTFIFPADRNQHTHSNYETANKALKRIGFKDRLVAHGMRSIASTKLNEEGFDFDVIEAALAHADGNEVRRAYNRTNYLERRRVMMVWWSDYIEKAAMGNMSLACAK